MAQTSTEEDGESLLKLYLRPLLPYLGKPGLDGEAPMDGVAEIMINRPDDIWVERFGRVEKTNLVIEPQYLENLVVYLAGIARNIGGEGAIFNVYHWGLRIAATLPPTSHMGISLSIRRKMRIIVPLREYAQSAAAVGTPEIPDPADKTDLLRWLNAVVAERKTILVAGGTSSGKTTFLNALLSCIPEQERLLTIEDSPELEPAAPNIVRFVASAQLNISPRDLIKQALRYRPDRIIVGEVRGEEALDMLDACNTGHDGSMTSIHANSPLEALGRLETLVMRAAASWTQAAIRQTISTSIHYVIQMRRRSDGGRGISDILALHGITAGGQYDFRPIPIPE